MQGREGVSAAQRPEALVPSKSGNQSTTADDELRVDRDRVRLRDALLPAEAQPVREDAALARGGECRDRRRKPRERPHEKARARHRRDREGLCALVPQEQARRKT